MIEPHPVAQKSSADAAKRASSPARSRSPRSLTAASAVGVDERSADGRADGHREGVVVERAAVGAGRRRGGVERGHQVGAPAEGAERQAAGEVLAERRHVRRDAEQLLGAARRARRDVITSSKISTAPVAAVSRAQRGEERRVAGDAAARARASARRARRRCRRRGGELGLDRGDVVVRQDGVVERDAAAARRRGRSTAGRRGSRASNTTTRPRPVAWRAVISAIRLASVPEFVNRTCSIDGKRATTASANDRLRLAHRPVRPAPVEDVADRAGDDVAAAEQAGRVVAEEVDVVVAVGVVEDRAVGADDAEGERLDVQHGAGVAAGQDAARPARRAPGCAGGTSA